MKVSGGMDFGDFSLHRGWNFGENDKLERNGDRGGLGCLFFVGFQRNFLKNVPYNNYIVYLHQNMNDYGKGDTRPFDRKKPFGAQRLLFCLYFGHLYGAEARGGRSLEKLPDARWAARKRLCMHENGHYKAV